MLYSKNLINQFLGLNLETDLRVVTFQKLMGLDSMTISEYNSGELLQILNHDTIMFKQMFCRMIPNIIDSIFVLGLTTYLLSTINLWFILIPLALMPFLAAALMRFRKKAKANFRKIRECDSRMNLTVQENIEEPGGNGQALHNGGHANDQDTRAKEEGGCDGDPEIPSENDVQEGIEAGPSQG